MMNTQLSKKHVLSAVEQSKSSRDDHVKISSNLNAGTCLISLGEYKNGLEYLDTAKAIIKGLQITSPGVDESGLDLSETQKRESTKQDSSLLEMGADVHYNSAVALHCIKQYEKAVLDFKSCIDLYLRAGSRSLAADALTCLGSCYREQNEMDMELQSLSSARHLYNELLEVPAEALVCVDIAKAQLRMGRMEECQRLIGDSQTLCLKIHDKCNQGKLQVEYGLIYSSMGLFEDAITCFKRALPLLRTQQNSKLKASVVQNIGAVYNERGMYAEAVYYHREAISLHDKSKNVSAQSKCLCNLAFAQTQMKEFTNAAHSFSLALRKAHKANSHHLLFQASEGLGAVYYRIGRYGEAVNHFKQCLEFLNNIKEDTGIARERVLEKLSDAIEASQKADTSGPSHHTTVHDQSLGTSDHPSHNHILSQNNPPPSSSLDEGLRTPVRKHARVVRNRKHVRTVENRQVLERRGSYEADMTAYMQTYQESSIASSSEITDQDINHRETDEQIDTTPVYVREGSLALGVNTRELYTTKTHTVNERGKGKLMTEIVLIRECDTESTSTTDRTQQSVSSRACNIL